MARRVFQWGNRLLDVAGARSQRCFSDNAALRKKPSSKEKEEEEEEELETR